MFGLARTCHRLGRRSRLLCKVKVERRWYWKNTRDLYWTISTAIEEIDCCLTAALQEDRCRTPLMKKARRNHWWFRNNLLNKTQQWRANRRRWYELEGMSGPSLRSAAPGELLGVEHAARSSSSKAEAEQVVT